MLLALVLASATVAEQAPPPVAPGSRVGLIAVLETKLSSDGLGALTGGGLRVGLRARTTDPVMFMPGLALLAGASVDPDRDFSGWLETRFECMAIKPGGLLQPTVHGYVSTGVTLGQSYLAPLRGVVGAVAARPYVALGGGWNWNPADTPRLNLGRLELGAGVVGVVAMLPLILAGRLELRFTPAVNPDEHAEVAVLTGFGF